MNLWQCAYRSAAILLCISTVVAKPPEDTSSLDNTIKNKPSSQTSFADLYRNINRRPTQRPTKRNQGRRSLRPTQRPTKRKQGRHSRRPSPKPNSKGNGSKTTFRRGELGVNVPSLGIMLSTGMSVRVIARANQKVKLANNKLSAIPFHSMPDGAHVFPLPNGYVYVSNSEIKDGNGGVYAVYFDHNSKVMGYKKLLSGTTRNCSGGATPWNTWISCEEYGKGQCWQVDPNPASQHAGKPEMTVLGQDGGSFESVACDNSNPSKPVFYLTEDAEDGALRRFRPRRSSGWNTLHNAGGTFDYLKFLNATHFIWTADIDAARASQQTYFRNVEGIDYFGGMLYFISKKTYLLYTLDLKKFTYSTSSTNQTLFGDGEFNNSPDQLIRGKGGEVIYLTEDGGKSIGVYAIDKNNKRYAIFEAYSDIYHGDETTGLAFSPDGRKMYACFQDCGCENSDGVDFRCGCLMEFSRTDGKSFDGSTLSLKRHAASGH